jgi:sortase (surface protein transpeptidase)
MMAPAPEAVSKLDPKRWWVLVVVLLVVGTGFLLVSLLGQQDQPGGPAAAPQMTSLPAGHPSLATARPSKKPPAKPTVPSARPGIVARSVPVRIRIPAIGMSAPLSTLGLNRDGTVQVPTNFQEAGWFRLGPSPGQMGSAVILGHVDSSRGPAAFYRLSSLRAGDKVDVSLAGGVVAHFLVKTMATYKKSSFPAQQVYGSHGYSGLQLVTCGGQFDSQTGHYLSNVVAYTSLVSTTPAGKK